jgi:WD40 repeat protein
LRIDKRLLGTFALSADGSLLALNWEDRPALLGIPSGHVIRRFLKEDNKIFNTDYVSKLAISPDNKRVALVNRNQGLRVFQAKTGKLVWQRSRSPADRNMGFSSGLLIAFAPDSRTLLVSPYRGGVMEMWDTATGKRILL